MEWSVQQIAGVAGTTGRTLRHYDTIGLLKPGRTGGNGYRFYDQAALVRLQRILLLRDLGPGLPGLAGVLASEPTPTGHSAATLPGWSRNSSGWPVRSPRSGGPLRQ
ncbi:MerR family transcriptional regulator [Pseudarthrobacter sp. So.54]